MPFPRDIVIEIIGWASTASFLFSILVPNRLRLHQIGIFASITTGIYAYAHDATAIWVKWLIALFFHAYMIHRALSEKAEALPQPQAI